MDVFIEKAKVKKVLRRKEYQEVFFKSRLLNGSKSLKIYDCEKDIASLLKKSFWGCRSVFEIHWLRLFPAKVCLDGVPLREFEEKDYPEELKIRLMPEEERDKMFLDRLSAFLQSYPKKDDFDVAVYSLPSLWLRAYACALLGKARKNGYLDDELQQRRYSLMLDLLKMLDEPDCWLPLFVRLRRRFRRSTGKCCQTDEYSVKRQADFNIFCLFNQRFALCLQKRYF